MGKCVAMNEQIDLKQIERQAFLSYHKDGLLDLCMGGALTQLGILIALFPQVLGGLMGSTILWLFMYYSLKKGITIPRLGYVEFAPSRQDKIFAVVFVFVVIFAGAILSMMLVLLLIPNSMPVFEANYMLILAVGGAITLCTAAYFSGIRRFYGYGLLFGILFVWNNFWFQLLFFPLLLIGLLSLIIGIIMLFRFIRHYPKAEGYERDKEIRPTS